MLPAIPRKLRAAVLSAIEKGFNPNEPRDAYGRWTETGAAHAHSQQDHPHDELQWRNISPVVQASPGGYIIRRDARTGTHIATHTDPKTKVTTLLGTFGKEHGRGGAQRAAREAAQRHYEQQRRVSHDATSDGPGTPAASPSLKWEVEYSGSEQIPARGTWTSGRYKITGRPSKEITPEGKLIYHPERPVFTLTGEGPSTYGTKIGDPSDSLEELQQRAAAHAASGRLIGFDGPWSQQKTLLQLSQTGDDLHGTPRQRVWANDIRSKIFKELLAIRDGLADKAEQRGLTQEEFNNFAREFDPALNALLHNVTARFWIDNRAADPMNLLRKARAAASKIPED